MSSVDAPRSATGRANPSQPCRLSELVDVRSLDGVHGGRHFGLESVRAAESIRGPPGRLVPGRRWIAGMPAPPGRLGSRRTSSRRAHRWPARSGRPRAGSACRTRSCRAPGRCRPWPAMVAPPMVLPTLSALMPTGSGPAEVTIFAAKSLCASSPGCPRNPATNRRSPMAVGTQGRRRGEYSGHPHLRLVRVDR